MQNINSTRKDILRKISSFKKKKKEFIKNKMKTNELSQIRLKPPRVKMPD